MPRAPLADGVNVVGLLLGQIGDADAAGQIDEGDMCVGLALKAHGKLKEDARKLGVVVVGDGVAGKECVDTKVLGALGLEHAEGLEELLGGHAVLGVARVVHDAVGELEQAARIKAATDCLGDGPRDTLKELDMADVVKVDDGAQLVGELKVGSRRVVGREHDVVSRDTQRAGDHELGIARAIAAAAVFVENGDERRVGVGLDGKVFLKARVPCKGVAHLLACCGGCPPRRIDETAWGTARRYARVSPLSTNGCLAAYASLGVNAMSRKPRYPDGAICASNPHNVDPMSG